MISSKDLQISEENISKQSATDIVADFGMNKPSHKLHKV